MANSKAEKLTPNPDLKALEKFVGTWQWSGSLEGESTYEWAEGGFFLLHYFDFEQGRLASILIAKNHID